MKTKHKKLALVAKLFGGLCIVALLVFNVTSVVNNENSSELSLSSLVTSANAQGEGGSGGCVDISIVYNEGVSMRPTACCQTEYQHYTDIWECYLGDGCPCRGRHQETVIIYVGQNCCA